MYQKWYGGRLELQKMRDTSIVAVRGESSNSPAAGLKRSARVSACTVYCSAATTCTHRGDSGQPLASAQAQPTRIPFHARRIIFDTANYRSIAYLSWSFDQICWLDLLVGELDIVPKKSGRTNPLSYKVMNFLVRPILPKTHFKAKSRLCGT